MKRIYRALGLQLVLIPFTASRPRYMQSVNMVTDIDRTGTRTTLAHWRSVRFLDIRHAVNPHLEIHFSDPRLCTSRHVQLVFKQSYNSVEPLTHL